MQSTQEFELSKLLDKFSKDPLNIDANIALAKSYFEKGQYASAISFLNRIAELSDDKDQIYESMCLAAECFVKFGGRDEHVKICAMHAITQCPKRPEAYLWLSQGQESQDERFGAYTAACIGLEHLLNAKNVTGLPFPYIPWRLYYQKGINAWWCWKVDECRNILYDLYKNYKLEKFWTDNLKWNLDKLGWPEGHKQEPWNVTDWPTMEFTTSVPKKGCVVDCVFCPQEVLKKSFEGERRLTLENFKKALSTIPKNVRITFSGFVEPWMNKQTTDMLLYAHEQGYPVCVFTTGVGMSVEDVRRIKDVPFAGGPNGGFTLHLPDSDYLAKHPITDKYVEVIEEFAKHNIQNFSIMIMGGEVHERVRHVYPSAPTYDMWWRAGNLVTEAKLKPELIPHMGRVNTIHHEGPTTCGCIEDLYHNIMLPNGNVALCCMDYNGDHILGNLLTQSYEEIMPEQGTAYSLCNFCENGVSCSSKK